MIGQHLFTGWMRRDGHGVRILERRSGTRANCYCERSRNAPRECLDYLIPFGEEHLRRILGAWKVHYNRDASCLAWPGLPSHRPFYPRYAVRTSTSEGYPSRGAIGSWWASP